jgi:hypothetical protein
MSPLVVEVVDVGAESFGDASPLRASNEARA